MTTVPQNGQVGVWEIVFVPRAGPKTIPKSAIIDERGIKISEDDFFSNQGHNFPRKGVRFAVRVVKYLRLGIRSRQLAEVGQQVWPRTYIPHAPEVRMT